MKPKVLIFLLIFLVILFVVWLIVGFSGGNARWGQGDFDLANADWADTIRGWFTQSLTADDIIDVIPGRCWPDETRFIVTPDSRCTLSIRGVDNTTRQLQLELLEGERITVIVEQENALTVEAEISRTTEPTSIDIYRNTELRGATLVLRECIAESKESDEETSNDAPEQPAHCLLALR